MPAEQSEGARPDSEAEWEEVRRLLVGQEQKKLAALTERIDNPALHARDVSAVLPQAVEISSSQSAQLSLALTPSVESALKESVKKNPQVLVDAIFPVIGPAIRRAIAEALARMVQSLNTTLEHSFSWRSWRWRLEAKRTGRPFAEVVLCHTLVYRVEQVFLIHGRTGLLLQQAALPEIGLEDSDMVSGMFTAIQDFVRDSFRVSEQESLLSMRIGDLAVWIEAGPEAYLAAVIQGTAPESLRPRLQVCLEQIHLEMGSAMDSFEGDALPFSRVQPLLESCLEAQFGENKPGAPWKAVVVVLLLLGAIGWWSWGGINQNRRWNRYLGRLQVEPGLLVMRSGRQAGKYYVAGLQDPMARDPEQLLGETGLHTNQVVGRWEPYHALAPEIVLQRVIQKLQPPAGVILEWSEGRILRASGSAPQAWVERARAQASLFAGVDGVDLSGVQDTGLARLLELEKELEGIVVVFGDGVQWIAGGEDQIGEVAARVSLLGQLAEDSGRPWELWVAGHADAVGREDLNLVLSRQRAELVARELIGRGVAASLLHTRGAGSTEPGAAAGGEGDRRVTFQVRWLGEKPGM